MVVIPLVGSWVKNDIGERYCDTSERDDVSMDVGDKSLTIAENLYLISMNRIRDEAR